MVSYGLTLLLCKGVVFVIAKHYRQKNPLTLKRPPPTQYCGIWVILIKLKSTNFVTKELIYVKRQNSLFIHCTHSLRNIHIMWSNTLWSRIDQTIYNRSSKYLRLDKNIVWSCKNIQMRIHNNFWLFWRQFSHMSNLRIKRESPR